MQGQRSGRGATLESDQSHLPYSTERARPSHGRRGAEAFDDGGSYEGEFHAGKREGRGRAVYVDGGVFEGEWVGGARHGHGAERFANGYFYEGEWPLVDVR